MTQIHEVEYRVTASRNNISVVDQHASTREEAEALAQRISGVPGTTVTIEEVHDPAETDLTTLTRERSREIGSSGGSHPVRPEAEDPS